MPGWLPLIDEEAASLCIVAIIHVSAVFEFVCLDLPMHLPSSWIHRAALIRIRLIAVSESFACKESAVPVVVIGLVDLMRDRVAVMYGLTPELIQRCVLRDRGQVMSANVGAFALITVIDVRKVRRRDFSDLTDASGRRGSPHIRCGVTPRVLNGSDVPGIRIIIQPGGVVSWKISVMIEHLIVRLALSVRSAGAVAVIANAGHQVSISDDPSLVRLRASR